MPPPGPRADSGVSRLRMAPVGWGVRGRVRLALARGPAAPCPDGDSAGRLPDGFSRAHESRTRPTPRLRHDPEKGYVPTPGPEQQNGCVGRAGTGFALPPPPV